MNTPYGTLPQSILAIVFSIRHRAPFVKVVTLPLGFANGVNALATRRLTSTRLPCTFKWYLVAVVEPVRTDVESGILTDINTDQEGDLCHAPWKIFLRDRRTSAGGHYRRDPVQRSL